MRCAPALRGFIKLSVTYPVVTFIHSIDIHWAPTMY